MPNWCNNKLTVTGPKLTVNKFENAACGSDPSWGNEPAEVNEPEIFNFHILVPIPARILALGFDPAGYEWCTKNWGTKWGASDSILDDKWDGQLHYSFNTAWAPPIEFLTALGKKWPKLTFVLEYEECGMGFKGLCKVKGATVEDHCINL